MQTEAVSYVKGRKRELGLHYATIALYVCALCQ
jgi:hypothetical protein